MSCETWTLIHTKTHLKENNGKLNIKISVYIQLDLKQQGKTIKRLFFLTLLCKTCRFLFHTLIFSIGFVELQATFPHRVNESPERSSTGADRTERTITPCAPHQLSWLSGWWARCHLTAAMEPLWWKRWHVLWCANCSTLLLLEVLAVLLLLSLVTDRHVQGASHRATIGSVLDSHHFAVIWVKKQVFQCTQAENRMIRSEKRVKDVSDKRTGGYCGWWLFSN